MNKFAFWDTAIYMFLYIYIALKFLKIDKEKFFLKRLLIRIHILFSCILLFFKKYLVLNIVLKKNSCITRVLSKTVSTLEWFLICLFLFNHFYAKCVYQIKCWYIKNYFVIFIQYLKICLSKRLLNTKKFILFLFLWH